MTGGAGMWSGGQNRQTSYRHDEGANLLMFDGHVEYRPKAGVYYFKASGGPDHGKTNALWHVYR